MLAAIAQDSGMDPEAAAASLATFVFPTIEEQLSEAWLGGAAPAFMKGVADVFVESGSIPSSLDDYTANVNTGPLAAAQ
jgi:taurine transport system substrate-binding protein